MTTRGEREWNVEARLRWQVYGHLDNVRKSALALEQAAKLSFHGGVEMVLLDYEPAGGPEEAAVGLQEPLMDDHPSVEVRGPLGATESPVSELVVTYEAAFAVEEIPQGSAVRLLLDPKTNRVFITRAT